MREVLGYVLLTFVAVAAVVVGVILLPYIVLAWLTIGVAQRHSFAAHRSSLAASGEGNCAAQERQP